MCLLNNIHALVASQVSKERMSMKIHILEVRIAIYGQYMVATVNMDQVC